jgi:hypothetical protein
LILSPIFGIFSELWHSERKKTLDSLSNALVSSCPAFRSPCGLNVRFNQKAITKQIR